MSTDTFIWKPDVSAVRCTGLVARVGRWFAVTSVVALGAACGTAESDGPTFPDATGTTTGVPSSTTGPASSVGTSSSQSSNPTTSASSGASSTTGGTTSAPSTTSDPTASTAPVTSSSTSTAPVTDSATTDSSADDSSTAATGDSSTDGTTDTDSQTPTTSDETTSDGSQGSPNLFETIGGKSPAEIDAKVETAVHRFFGIGANEPTTPTQDTGYRCYYELPSDTSMAFIWAADTNDIRSEGQSYGMTIAVQMDLKTEFDKLWRFAKAKMQYPANTQYSAWKYYFKWQGFPSGNDWNFGASTVPAPDGDEYFAAALYMADQRWGSDGEINYKQEADNIATALLHNAPTNDGRFPIFHATQRMIVFVPFGNSNEFTDPSYHLPAFYEMFALYGPSADAGTWRELAEVSRDYLVRSAHPSTGLHPDYATFAGVPTTGSPGDGHDQFRYDAWRVVMNMGVDYAWFSADERMKTQTEKYHAFFANHLGQNNVTNALFHVDGSNASGGGSTALTATLAAGALASQASNRADYIEALWNVPQQQGLYRYYQESVYLLGLLNVAGKFKYSW